MRASYLMHGHRETICDGEWKRGTMKDDHPYRWHAAAGSWELYSKALSCISLVWRKSQWANQHVEHTWKGPHASAIRFPTISAKEASEERLFISY